MFEPPSRNPGPASVVTLRDCWLLTCISFISSYPSVDTLRDCWLLTCILFISSYPPVDTLRDRWLFQQDKISEILGADGIDVSRISTPFTQKPFTAMFGNVLLLSVIMSGVIHILSLKIW